MSYIDLHMHSHYSDDGEFSVKELVKMNKDAGIKIMAIADHNWVKANNEARVEANKLGITYIDAIEIDCTYKGVNLHVLGYGIDSNNPKFNQLGENILIQERECSLEKLTLTNQLGFDLSKEDLDAISDNGVYTGEMFAEVLLNDPRYNDHPLLKPYRQGGNRGDNPYVNFYWDYYAQGKPCFTKINYPSLEETIQLIHDNHGKAVLAHPGNNLKGQFELFDEMIDLGIDGVEAYSSYHTKQTNEYFYNKAIEKQLLYTCGSDFHGKTKPAIKLGKNGCEHPEDIEKLLRKYELI